MKYSYNYRLVSSSQPTHVLSIQGHWKDIPRILSRIRTIPVNIVQSQLTTHDAVVYMVETGTEYRKEGTYSLDVQHKLIRLVQDAHNDDEGEWTNPDVKLPVDTKIDLYNLSNVPFTTLDFKCRDRIGLLHDLVAFIASLPVDIHSAYITTLEGTAHNIVHLQKNGLPLTWRDIEYVRNVFEYEGKDRPTGHELHMPIC